MTTNFSRVIQESSFQGLGGIVLGTIVDNIFPSATEVNNGNFIKVTGEVFLQMLADGVITATYFDFLSRRGYRSDDPTKGFVWAFMFQVSQNHLITKVAHWSSFVADFFKNKYIGPSSTTTQSVSAPGYITTGNASTNKETYTLFREDDVGTPSANEQITRPPWIMD